MQKRKIFEAILKIINKNNDNDIILKTKKKSKKANGNGADNNGEIEEVSNSDYYNDSDDSDDQNPLEEDEGLQEVLDEIKNSESDKNVLIDLVKRAFYDLSLFVGCCCSRTNGFAVGLHGAGIVTLFNENSDGKFYKHSSSSINEHNKTMNILS